MDSFCRVSPVAWRKDPERLGFEGLVEVFFAGLPVGSPGFSRPEIPAEAGTTNAKPRDYRMVCWLPQ